MRFTKMNGAGNDFILLDAIAEPFDESAAPALARALCDRRRSVGADGLMLATRAEGDADYRMRFYNSDGSLGEMCGNGARCICRYGYARGYAGPVQRVETTAGLVIGWRITEEQYRIRLNTPSVVELEKQLATIAAELETLSSEAPEEEQTPEQMDQRYARIAQLRSEQIRFQQELETIKAKGTPTLTMDNIARVIEMWTKIPASKIKEEEFQRLSQLETRLKKHIVGQDEAVAAVAAAIRRNRVGISPKHKPVSFIFVGSTGVGKTELVKQLADDLFNAPESLIRLDMSEFMEKHSVSRIVGSPPGYVGYDEAGQLTEKIRRKPYSVVLFDEIEKAHPDVLNVLLQILDDGQITDAHGRKVNFENTVIVMTSNAGSDKAAGSVGFDKSAGDQGKERVMKALRDFLRPEFINRVDEVIYFRQLTEDNFRDIARIMLDELKTSLADKGFGFMSDGAVVDVLVKKSYSAAYGARNLRRCIQKELEDPMANLIIDAFENPITQLKATAEDGQIKLYSL